MKRALGLGLLLIGAVSAHADVAGTGTHFIYVVRHGIYDRDSASTDDRKQNGLNAKGHQQARLVGERLARLPVHFDRLISSELLRAKETADDMGLVMHLTPTRDTALDECTPTSMIPNAAGTTPARVAACDAARLAEWSRYFVPTPARNSYDVLVSHGNVIRWTLLRALGADPRTWPLLDSANASITIFAIAPEGTVRLVSYDDVGHLPAELQTWTGAGGGYGG